MWRTVDSLGALQYKGVAKKACRIQSSVTKIPKGIECMVYEGTGSVWPVWGMIYSKGSSEKSLALEIFKT